MLKIIFTFAGISGFVAIALGAFGAHGLRGRLDEASMHAFETAVSYQISHTLVIIFCCIMIEQWGRHWTLEYAAYAFTVGILLFSGSLYLLTVLKITYLGPVTPLGGLCFLIGWTLLTIGIWHHTSQ